MGAIPVYMGGRSMYYTGFSLYSDERFEYDVAVPVDVWTGQTILAKGFLHELIV